MFNRNLFFVYFLSLKWICVWYILILFIRNCLEVILYRVYVNILNEDRLMDNLDLKGIKKFKSIIFEEEVLEVIFNKSRIIIVIK